LVRLVNARKMAARWLPRHHTVVCNNRTLHSRIVELNISHPRSANNGATARTKQVEGSFHGHCGAKRSNPSVLPFLEMHTSGRSFCTPTVATRRGPNVTDAENPLVKRMVGLDQFGWY
jgi:hypothetical protein